MDHGQNDGLIVNNMNTSLGGKQSKIRPSLIEQETISWSTLTTLKLGGIQHMQFSESETGPYYMDPMTQEL